MEIRKSSARDEPARVRFGEFVLDRETHELTRAGAPIPLSPKEFDLLSLLITAHPRALPKAEILDRLWADAVVSHGSLPQLVSELRRHLGDDARQPRFVRTVFGHGYAFCGAPEQAPRRSVPRAPVLCLLVGERELLLEPGSYVLGRDPDADVPIPSTRASRRHARLDVDADGGALLLDLDSKNGTLVGGARITGPVALMPGDRFQIGAVTAKLHSLYDADTETG